MFKAYCKVRESFFALKFIENIFETDTQLKCVLREVMILRQFTRMNGYKHASWIYNVYTLCKPDGEVDVCMVMDYESRALDVMMEKSDQAPFSENSITKYIYSLLCSLNYMHSANVMHRDMKPKNILIQTGKKALICDYRYARTMVDSRINNDLSKEEKTYELIKDRKGRHKLKRQLTEIEVAREYRPPEIILLEK